MKNENNLNFMNTILVEDTPRNKFDLSHDVKLSMDMGELVPTAIIEVVPGDRFEMGQDFMIRFAPMIAPVMNRFKAYVHFFYVPSRILTDGKIWEKFITQSPLKRGDELPILPRIDLQGANIAPSDLGDYMSIPTLEYPSGEQILINALPAAGYFKIYDEYYRDQDLIDPLFPEDGLGEGEIDTDFILQALQARPLKRARALDYFTAARPWPQGNIEQVTIPITGLADIEYNADDFGGTDYITVIRNPQAATHPPVVTSGDIKNVVSFAQSDPSGTDPQPVSFDNSMVLRANLSESVTSTINDFRKAWAIQQFYELNGRAGTRYNEWVWAHYGVKTDDASLQRPQYLGGGMQEVQVSDVTQTNMMEDNLDVQDTPLGTKAGEAWAIGSSKFFDQEFSEHGYIYAITSVMPEVTYMQGLQKIWSKLDPFDYYVPQLAEIGEQAVLTKELYFTGVAAVDNDIFGYLPPFSEYRTMLNRVCGDFRETLLYWHLADVYDTQPLLGQAFIEQDPAETKRIFAIQDIPDPDGGQQPVRNYNVLYAHVYNKIEASRKIPMFGTPAKLV